MRSNIHFPSHFLSALCHYSLIARSQGPRRYFLEHCSWESAAPPLKDPDRVPAPSTLRRWCQSLDCSRPAFSFLRPALEVVGQWLIRGERLECGSLPLSWQTVFPVSASLLAAAPVKGTRVSYLPTIFAWELAPRVRSLGQGERCPTWARIWNGSNSAFLCSTICNGTTGPATAPAPPANDSTCEVTASRGDRSFSREAHSSPG